MSWTSFISVSGNVSVVFFIVIKVCFHPYRGTAGLINGWLNMYLLLKSNDILKEELKEY